jgi:hypothetical protein
MLWTCLAIFVRPGPTQSPTRRRERREVEAMVPLTVKVPVPYDYVFPHGALCLGVEPVKDFDAKGGDDQARDKETGRRCGRCGCWTWTRRRAGSAVPRRSRSRSLPITSRCRRSRQ